ncbi:MAG: hypothetical protein B9S34_00550 [Opitutia bacterium Tous-C1TDCM]|nr:MAG: hypothetical protein B9S34_00550 [Opitutae bacterium Tous-C1TDCM]
MVAPAGQTAARPLAPRPDRISTESAAFLRAELARQPEIRPEVVARGRELAADSSYPSFETLRSVAQQILQAPDLSEDQS